MRARVIVVIVVIVVLAIVVVGLNRRARFNTLPRWLVHRSVISEKNIFELRAMYAFWPLPSCLRLSCCVLSCLVLSTKARVGVGVVDDGGEVVADGLVAAVRVVTFDNAVVFDITNLIVVHVVVDVVVIVDVIVFVIIVGIQQSHWAIQ